MGYMDTSGSIAGISGRPFNVLLGAIICPAVAFFFVLGRWYVRLRITKALRFDDLLAAATLASNVAYSVLLGLACRNEIGVGRHISSFAPSEESEYYKWVYIYDTFYITSLLGYKTTILCLYLRIFGVRKEFKIICWIALFIVDGYLVATLVVQLISCVPPHKFWDKEVAGWCIDDLSFDIAYGCLNVVTDFMIAILPIREIWRLFMPLREKVWSTLIFSAAFLAFGTAVVCQTYRFNDLFSKDRTWDAAVTFTWQAIEINTGLICSCLPALLPLYRATVDSLIRTFTSGSSPGSVAGLVRIEMRSELDGAEAKGNAHRVHDRRKHNHQLNPLEPGGPMTEGEHVVAERLGRNEDHKVARSSQDSSPSCRGGDTRRTDLPRGKNSSFDRDLEIGIGLSEEERCERAAWAGRRDVRSTMSGDTFSGDTVRVGIYDTQEGRWDDTPEVVPREGAASRQRWLSGGTSRVTSDEDSLVLSNELRELLERQLAEGKGLII